MVSEGKTNRVVGFRGKVIGSDWYIHKDSLIYLEPQELFDQFLRYTHCLAELHSKKIPDVCNYDVVKLTVYHGEIVSVTFLYISGWNTLKEPILSYSVKNTPYPRGCGVTVREYHGDSAPVYHHKWMMTMPNMAKFDYAASKIRSEQWENNPVIKEMKKNASRIKSKIGFKGFWRDVCAAAGIACDY